MKRVCRYLLLVLSLGLLSVAQAEDKLKPFVLASSAAGELEAAVEKAKQALSRAGFELVGEYIPYKGAQLLLVSSDGLKAAASKTQRGAYAAVQRVALVKTAQGVDLSYTNPIYMANAYQLDADLKSVSEALARALGRQQEFGAEGLSAKELRDYHYAFGMEYFDEPYRLAEHKSFQEAVAKVDANLQQKLAGVSLVYRVEIPGRDQVLYGVAMQPGEKNKYADDAFIMSVIDARQPSSAAHLPYELLVNGNQVEALHARFRIAIDFPDLKMMGDNSFMQIMNSPAAIESVFGKVAGGERSEALY